MIGRYVERIGLLGLPLGVGAVLGFFAADQGVRFVPTLLAVFLIASAVSLLLIVVGRYVAGRAYRVTPREKPGSVRVEGPDRVRVLERIVTDKGYDVATQIEALRDQRRVEERLEDRTGVR